ncbi:MAG: M36 family metallopeptidase [Saprospiraceae bacterium]
MNIPSCFSACPKLLFALFALAFVLPVSAQRPSKAGLAKQLVQEAQSAAGRPVADLGDLNVCSETHSPKSGVTHVYFQQHLAGIPVHNSILNVHVTKDDKLLTHSSRLVPVPEGGMRPARAVLTPEQAVEAAAVALGLSVGGRLVEQENKGGPDRAVVFEKGSLSLEGIPVRLVWQPIEDGGLRLAWDLSILEVGGQNWWSVRMDAETGELLEKNNWIVRCDFGSPHAHAPLRGSKAARFDLPGNLEPGQEQTLACPMVAGGGAYRVFPEPMESPYDGLRQLISDPADATASPFGWHDIDGIAGAEHTTTKGNNVHVYTDLDQNGDPDPNSSPNGGTALQFDFPLDLTQPPSAYQNAALVNLFYWNNYLHDFAYQYGFDEAAGNFQKNNYGNGGIGGDYVRAVGQLPDGSNNAFFGTPADGAKPFMGIYLGTNPNPDVDISFDNGVVAHEYAHGISNRLTGGPSNPNCLGNEEQMGEGWSDYFALMTTLKPTDTGVDARGIGNYMMGQPANGNGVRPSPYSTDMSINPATYKTIKTVLVPHGVGYVWAGMLWDMTWALMDAHGQAAGYDIALTLVVEGMKLQPCSPGFVDGRDAILAADEALYSGQNQCLIWRAFARRGLGFSASQGSSDNRNDGTEAFDLPADCPGIWTTSLFLALCENGNATTTTVHASAGISSGNLTLSADGPSGTSLVWGTNPVAPGGSSVLTINSGTTPPGDYLITVVAANSTDTFTSVFQYTVNEVPGVPVLVFPANMATDVFPRPILDWDVVPGASNYTIQVSTVPNFATTVFTSTFGNTSLAVFLSDNTTYYWRVRANTPFCSTYSATFTFTTNCQPHLGLPTLQSPANGATGVSLSPLLNWADDPNRTNYTLEVAENPGFNPILSTQFNLTASQSLLPFLLETNTTYYWRVHSNTQCQSPGDPSEVFSFTTNSVAPVCTTMASTNVPIAIPSTSTSTINSVLAVPICGTVADINITNLYVEHTSVGDLEVELISPQGTVVTLAYHLCGNTDDLRINFDDQAANQYSQIPCPPANNGTYRPNEKLSTLFRQSIAGNWTLRIHDTDATDGGSIESWSLNICYLPVNGTPVTCYRDADNDSFGNPNLSSPFCSTCPSGWTLNNTDCNDTKASVNPNKPEICDFLDNDCDGLVDEGFSIVTCYLDDDGDGYGNASVSKQFCGTCGFGYVATGDDCDDFNPDTHPGAAEVCDTQDNDCDGQVDEGLDEDNDGYTPCAGDCNDNDSAIHPGAAETCNGVDDNCDGITDSDPVAIFASTDGPMPISATKKDTVTSTITISGVSGIISDLNLRALKINHNWVTDLRATLTGPNNVTVSLFARPGITYSTGCFYNHILATFDDEAVQSAFEFHQTCEQSYLPDPPPYAIWGTFRSIGSLSAFDGISPNGTWTLTVYDDAVSGSGGALLGWGLQMTIPELVATWYADADGDTFGDPANSAVFNCSPPSGFVLDNTDCNDGDPDEHPGQVWYTDADGDGYGAALVAQCARPAAGFLLAELNGTGTDDCADNNAAIHPAATETCDGVDNDCDGLVDSNDPEFVDNTPPAITCPNAAIVTCSANVPAVNLAAVTASDACSVPVKSHVGDATTNQTCAHRKTITRTYRAADGSGNSATCSQVITVFDEVKPNFTVVPANVTVQCHSVPAPGTATATDGCGGTVSVVYNGQTVVAGSCSDASTLTRQWTATDLCGNTKTATQRITVIDTQKPTFVAVPTNVTVQCNAVPAPAVLTATDNCDASVAVTYNGQTTAAGSCPNAYAITRTWTAADNCGNTKTATQRITVVDNGKPAFTAFPDDATLSCSDQVPVVGLPTASDACGGTVTIAYMGQTTANSQCAGTYQIRRTWRATDACGNSTASTQTIQVIDEEPPVFNFVPAGVTIECGQPLPPLTNPTATDACSYAAVTFLGQTPSGNDCEVGYTITRTWQAADLCGSSTTAVQVITLQGVSYAPQEPENRSAVDQLKTQNSKLKTVTLQPNPTTDRVWVDLNDFTGEALTVAVFDEVGRVVWEQRLTPADERRFVLSLREAGAAAGVYTVSVRGASGVAAQRVVLVE